MCDNHSKHWIPATRSVDSLRQSRQLRWRTPLGLCCKVPAQNWHNFSVVSERPVVWARIFKLLRSPGIDSKELIPPAYVAWGAGTKTPFLPVSCPHRLFENSITEKWKHESKPIDESFGVEVWKTTGWTQDFPLYIRILLNTGNPHRWENVYYMNFPAFPPRRNWKV